MKRLSRNSVLVRAALAGALSLGVLGIAAPTAAAQDWAKKNAGTVIDYEAARKASR